MAELTEWVICYSRCLWCGRKTPHQVCHEHGHFFEPSESEMTALERWPNYYRPAEQCDRPDAECSMRHG